jgi:hypothetical protein
VDKNTPPVARLYLQLRRWYELLVLGQDPTTLVKPFAVIKGWRTTARALRLFVPQVIAAVSFTAMGIVGLIFSGEGAFGPLLGLAGAGLSITTIQGRLKNSSNALITRLRQDLYTDLVGTAITIVPPPPTKRSVEDAVRSRELTTAVGV